MPTTAPRIQLKGSAPITSCMGGNPISLLMLVWDWCSTQSWYLPLQSLYRKCENMSNGPMGRLNHSMERGTAPQTKLWQEKQGSNLGVWDTVLVHVTAFKGHHKIQNQWENREYVVERWPYPSAPVYLVCPRYWEGHSQTLHRKYLLPISSSLEQIEKDAPMAGVEHTSTSVPMPCVGSEPTDAEPSRMATSGTTGYSSQGSLDQAAPLRCSTPTTQNQLPWRYWNFALVEDTSLPGIFDVWVGLCICLHLISCLYTILMGSIV